jgi:hypothetical protein
MSLALRLLLLYTFAVLMSLYTYFIVRRLRKGHSRLLFAAPFATLALVLPLLLNPFNPAEATMITPLVCSCSAFGLSLFRHPGACKLFETTQSAITYLQFCRVASSLWLHSRCVFRFSFLLSNGLLRRQEELQSGRGAND